MKINKSIFFTFLFIFISSFSAQAVTIGPMQTKKERNRLNAAERVLERSHLSEEKLMAVFLREDHAQVDKMTKPLLGRSHSHPEYDEMLYIRALSLLKLNRTEEARSLLIQLERQGLKPEIKARAAYSLGDSYYFTSGDTGAYQNALKNYPFFDEADIVRMRMREKQPMPSRVIQEPAPALYTPPQAKPLQQMSIVETPLYSVQVGSFSREKNAKQLTSRLLRVNYDARVMGDDARKIFRVRVGSFVSKHDALILERKLKKEGYPTKIVP